MSDAQEGSLDLLGRLWARLPFSVRRRVLFATNHHFLVGVVGVIQNSEGQVLLLEHRFRAPHPWGLPGGFIRHGETLEEGLIRELHEEIGLTIEPRRLLDTEFNLDGRYVSAALLANAVEPIPTFTRPSNPEIIGGGFFSPAQFPAATYPYHRQIVQRFVS